MGREGIYVDTPINLATQILAARYNIRYITRELINNKTSSYYEK